MSENIEKKNSSTDESDDFLVVGLGASAGGLQVLETFFKSLPENSGMAFIVVLHLAPEKESQLAELLQKKTGLKVQTVSEKIEIKPDNVYVIPPNKMLSVEDNHLELTLPKKKHGLATVDLLFRTLARKKGKYAAGVILSGAGSDGTVGMKIIKKEGGITICEEPGEARHPGMPRSAIQTGVVDKVLPVKEIAEELLHYKESLSQVHLPEVIDDPEEEKEDKEQILASIFKRIHSETDHDFNNYRRSSVLRRIDRRMRVNRVKSLSEYLSYIEEYPDELNELYKDLLISVTNFFRDPEAFEALNEQVITELFEKKKDSRIRLWVPGCATGEEAYSIAMLLQEHIDETGQQMAIQIFASDVDEEALTAARAGRYPKSINNDLTDERLQRFFIENGEEYIINQDLRDMILFSSHDLLSAPPFSRLDLIACRNLLIYLNRDLQSEVFRLFHYALHSWGWLFLGKSDSSLGMEDLFKTIDKGHSIYRQKPSAHSRIPLPDMPLLYNKVLTPSQQGKATPAQRKGNIEKMHLNILTRLYAPQSVLIDKDYKVIHATEEIGKFLEYKGGEPSKDILDMIKSGLRQPLRSILFQLRDEELLMAQKKTYASDSGKKLEISARKFNDANFPEGLIHIVFKEIEKTVGKGAKKSTNSSEDAAGGDQDVIDSLEQELEYTKEQLQLSIEEYETSNEELRASNEELQSMNEELQSATEELETSKEELQSVNEELEILNDELEKRVAELKHAHSDLENLMEAMEVGVIFVDREYCVKRFTSSATDIFNLIPSDEGRPLQHITHNLEYEGILDDVKYVLESLEMIKKVVFTENNRWFIMRLRPYHTTSNKVQGVVLTFTEFTELKEAQDKVKEQSFQEVLATLGLYTLEKNDLQAIMERAIELSCIVLHLDCAVILSLDKEKNHLKMGAHSGCGQKIDPISVDEKWDVGFALHNKKPTVVTDYTNDERFASSPFLEEMNVISSVHLVIQSTEDTYGVLGFYSDENDRFTKDDINFMQIMANIIGMAIERDKFHGALEEKNRRLKEAMERSRQYQKEIINNSIVERWELGGYLHDNLGQLLASAKITASDIMLKLSKTDIDVSDNMDRIMQIIDESIEGIRDLTHDIILVDMEEEGVEHAFRFLMRQMQKLHNVECLLDAGEIINDIKNRKLATHLYHVVQEAIKNAAIHGKADRIKVSIYEEDGKMALQIEDNGLGNMALSDRKGNGVKIMEHRINLLGGSFSFRKCDDNSELDGMCIICTVPLEDLKAEKS